MHTQGQSRGRSQPHPQRGVALLVALLVVAILVAITLQFTYTTTIDLKLVKNQARETKSYYAARGVVALARAHLLDDLVKDGGMFAPDSFDDGWAGGDGDPEAGTLLSEGGAFHRTIGDVSLVYEIVDEDRKICVNNLALEELHIPAAGQAQSPLERPPLPEEGDAGKPQEPDPKALAKERREVTRELIKEILIQLNVEPGDADGLVAAIEEGAPYGSMSELLTIDGVTQELLVGSADEFGSRQGLTDFLTVYSMGEININTAPREVLVAIFAGRYGGEAAYFADAILEFRAPPLYETLPDKGDNDEGEEESQDEMPTGGVFATVDELAQRSPGLEDVFGELDEGSEEGEKPGRKLKRQLTVWSRFFSVKVTAGDTGPRREYSFVLKRGLQPDIPIPVLIWEERALPPHEPNWTDDDS